MTEWKNRIVDQGTRPASEFIANPKNWRTHPERQRKAVEGSLNELGWIDTVLVNRRTGFLIDGHERLWQALKAGEDTPVPFIEVDLSPEEEALALTVLDPIAGMATTDRTKLDELMQEIQTGEDGLMAMISELAEENELYIEHNGKDNSGASPWDRMNGSSAPGVLFTFGEIVCRINNDSYDRFIEMCPDDNIEDYICEILNI